jgi:hypothetical protein
MQQLQQAATLTLKQNPDTTTTTTTTPIIKQEDKTEPKPKLGRPPKSLYPIGNMDEETLKSLERKKLLKYQQNKKYQMKLALQKSKTHPATTTKSETPKGQQLLKRFCSICKTKVHQSKLSEHLASHFVLSPQCSTCAKSFKNATSYATHLLTHLPAQFYCVNCKKWFRQLTVFTKHQESDCGGPEPLEELKIRGRPPKPLATTIKTEPTEEKSKNLRKKAPTNYNEENYLQFDDDEQRVETKVTSKTLLIKREPKYIVNKLDFNRRLNNITKSKSVEVVIVDDIKREPEDDYDNELNFEGDGTPPANFVSMVNKEFLSLSPKDLSSCGTYKVRIQRRRSSASTNSTKENDNSNQSVNLSLNGNESNGILKEHRKNASLSDLLNSSPQKLMYHSSLASISEQQQQQHQLQSQDMTLADNINASSSFSSSFECPECEKKFVSYYGLVQHYDQHPLLKVTCMLCEITFENHHSLVLHNTNVHHLVEHFNDKVKENLLSTNQLFAKSVVSKNQAAAAAAAVVAHKSSVKSNFNVKSKSLLDETDSTQIDASNIISLSKDLSALPSIMTRTSRLATFSSSTNNAAVNAVKQSILGTSTNHPALLSKPSLITQAALLNHTLMVKTSGFADLSFIDFSCINFPRIAQNYCELWPRKLKSNTVSQHQFLQPLHNYMCDKCGFYFPCKASLQLHKIKKTFATSKLDLQYQSSSSSDASSCQLFMTNSKYLDYEKTLDEIITKIEMSEDLKKIEQKDKEPMEKSGFLKIFGLVNVASLSTKKATHLKSTTTTTTTTITTSTTNSSKSKVNLENFQNPAHPRTINLTERLLIKLRNQMLNINHQFIVDLNRWKFLHSNDNFNNSQHHQYNHHSQTLLYDAAYSTYSSKIHLKPHVNLNRPLLIRSKKLKRNAQRLLLQSITTKTPSLVSDQKANNATSKQSSLTNNDKVYKNTSPLKANPNSKTAPLTTIVTTTTTTTTTYTKPLFSSTSANFSAALTNLKTKQAPITTTTTTTATLKPKQRNNSLPLKRKLQPKPATDDQDDSDEDLDIINLPPPPTLLPIYTKSANSSRLASASGMMPPKLAKMTPDLTPPPTPTPMTNYEQLISMPKLRPQTSIVINNNLSNKYPLAPPQLEMFANKNGHNSSQLTTQQPQNAENISLKCKFCRTSFKGQSEFFQHVIVKHNQMVKQRINRARVESSSSSSSLSGSGGGGGGGVTSSGSSQNGRDQSNSSTASSSSSNSLSTNLKKATSQSSMS